MAGVEGGFISLHRRIEDWPLWRAFSAEQRMVVVDLLLHANWKASFVWDGAKRVEVKRGELIDSERTLAKRAKVGRKVVRTVLRQLEADQFLAQRKAQHFRVIFVIKYDIYQRANGGQAQDPAQPRPSPGPAPARSEQGEQGNKKDSLPPGKRAARVKAPPDPRHHPTRDLLERVFAEERGKAYGFGRRDARGVSEVLAFADATPPEIERRWRAGLNHPDRFLRCDAIYELGQPKKWNAYAGSTAPVRLVAAAPSHHSKFEDTPL